MISLCNQWLNTLITTIVYILLNIFLCHNLLRGIKRATKIPPWPFLINFNGMSRRKGNKAHPVSSLRKSPEIMMLNWNYIAKTFAKHQFHYLTILLKINNTDLQLNSGSELGGLRGLGDWQQGTLTTTKAERGDDEDIWSDQTIGPESFSNVANVFDRECFPSWSMDMRITVCRWVQLLLFSHLYCWPIQNCPSIHPLTVSSQVHRVAYMSLSLAIFSSSSWGIPKAFPCDPLQYQPSCGLRASGRSPQFKDRFVLVTQLLIC